MVCGAPTPRSSGGRSAVHTIRGTPAWWASTTAAWKWVAAVPLVHRATAGTPVGDAVPRAMNAAQRSSWCTCTAMRSSAARARASGVDRLPGATTARGRPPRAHSSTRVAQNVACVWSGRHRPTVAGASVAWRCTPWWRARGPRIVLVHGFAQTRRAGARLATTWPPTTRWCASTPRPRRPRRRSTAGLRRRPPDRRPRPGPATYLGYSMGGRLVLHLALAHPELVAGHRAGGRHRRHRRPHRAGSPPGGRRGPGRRHRGDGVGRVPRRWLALPLFAGLDRAHGVPGRAPGQNTADGLASSLRLAGTGQQEPAVGPAGPPRRADARGRRRADDEKFGALGRRIADGDRRQRDVRRRARRRPRRPPRAADGLPRRPPPLARPPRPLSQPNPRRDGPDGPDHAAIRPDAGQFGGLAGSGAEGEAGGEEGAVGELDPAGGFEHRDEVGAAGALEHPEQRLLGQEDRRRRRARRRGGRRGRPRRAGAT